MLNIEHHFARMMAFSRATFGPGERRKGIIDHIRKELDEIEAGDGDPKEWVDVIILGIDGLWRSLHARGWQWGVIPLRMATLLVAKQDTNEEREWPDWRTASPDKAIEHIRRGRDADTAD